MTTTKARKRHESKASQGAAKPLPQFGREVLELREAFNTNACRVVYVVKLRKAVYILRAFAKKSKSGIGIPKPDAVLIAARFERAAELDEESDDEKN